MDSYSRPSSFVPGQRSLLSGIASMGIRNHEHQTEDKQHFVCCIKSKKHTASCHTVSKHAHPPAPSRIASSISCNSYFWNVISTHSILHQAQCKYHSNVARIFAKVCDVLDWESAGTVASWNSVKARWPILQSPCGEEAFTRVGERWYVRMVRYPPWST